MNTAHPDPELLTLAALPAEPVDDDVATHLDECGQCRAHVDALRRTVGLARDAGVGEALPTPPPRVWLAIVEELGGDGVTADPAPEPGPPVAEGHAGPRVNGVAVAGRADTPADRPVDEGPGDDRPADDEPEGDATGTVTPLVGDRPTRRPRRRALVGVAAAAAVLGLATGLGIGVGVGGGSAPAPEPTPAVRLGPVGFADPAATGSAAMVERNGDQLMVMEVTGVTDLAGGDYLEAWLMDATGTRLQPLGALARHGEEFRGEFLVPAGLPVGEFDRVDVSAERFDGDPGHSAVSLLRGDLA